MAYHIVRTPSGRRCQTSKGKFTKMGHCTGMAGVRGRKHRKGRKSARRYRGGGLGGICTVCVVRNGKQVCKKVSKSWPRGKSTIAAYRSRGTKGGKGYAGTVKVFDLKSKRRKNTTQTKRFRAAAKQCGHKGKTRAGFRTCMSSVLRGVSSRRASKRSRKSA